MLTEKEKYVEDYKKVVEEYKKKQQKYYNDNKKNKRSKPKIPYYIKQNINNILNDY